MSHNLVGKLAFSFLCLPTALIFLGNGVANAGQTTDEVGAHVCVNDKWEETEPEKGHKLVDYAGRCVHIPDDPAATRYAGECAGKYEYMPDDSWKGSGTCTETFASGDKLYETWEEGSHLKEFQYRTTGGTGKYEGAKGGGTYQLDELTSTLYAGRYKGKLELP
jgi:hypothetical protein